MLKTKGFAQYLAGSLLVAFSIYQAFLYEPWECAMYATAGAAFISVGLIKDEKMPRYKATLSFISWVLIIAALILFFFLVRTD